MRHGRRVDATTELARPGLGLLLAVAAWAAPVAAQEALGAYLPPELPQFSPHPALLVVRATAALALVLGTIAATAWLARQRGLSRGLPTRGRRLHLIESLPLQPGRGIHLIGCGGKVLVLGSGPEGTAYLTEMSADELGWRPESEAPAEPETFLGRLQAVRLEAFAPRRQGA